MPQKSELPKGWEISTIKTLLVINYGKGLKKSDRVGGNFDVYGSNGIVGKHHKAITQGPTIIIGRKGSVGEVNFSPGPCWPIDTTYYIDDFSGMNVSFIYNLLTTLQLAKLDTSTAIPGINRNDIYSQEVIVPPLAEQHRIVAAIEALFARLDAAQTHIDRVPGIVQHFRQAVLAAACEGRLTDSWRADNQEYIDVNNLESEHSDDETISESFKLIIQNIPCGWIWTDVNSITLSMKNGIYKPSSYYSEDGFACLRMYNIENGKIVWKNIKRMVLSEKEIKEYLLESGDLLVNRVNSRELVGKAAPIPENIEKCIYESKNIRLRPDSNKISNYFLGFCFQLLANNFFNLNAQQTVGMASINQKQLGAMPIPLPPLPEQHEIIRRVDALFALADDIEERVNAARERTEKLRQSILAQAFSGRLVPTEAELARQEGRDYEPASVLLERIERERTEEAVKKKGKKKSRSP